MSADAGVAWGVDDTGIPDMLPWSGAFLEDTDGSDDGPGGESQGGRGGAQGAGPGSAPSKDA